MRTIRWLAVILVAVTWSVVAAPELEEFRGKVVHVTDGDTIVVYDRDRRRSAVRIVGIDAPEKRRRTISGQSYADRSRRHLSKLVGGKTVRLSSRGHDDYRRVLARVWIENVDVGLAQVCAGYAWVYEAFIQELSSAEQQAYRACQAKARADKRGLWRGPQPVPPWTWRHSKRSTEATP